MSDDESPDNVIPIPRIGSLPPPATPPVPALAADGDADPEGNRTADTEGNGGPETGRISPFDLPAPPVTPPPPGIVPATFRSEGTGNNPADAGPPRTGALSMAAILAIALAAFEGIHAWIQESGPRRAEAAKHKREMELLAAKAYADATKLTAEAGAERAKAQRNRGVQSSHDYGRGALGRSPGGSGRGAGPSGPGGSRRAPSGPSGGSTGGRGQGPGGPGARGGGGQRNTPGKPHSSGGTSPGRPNGPTGKGSGRPGSGSGGGGTGGGRGPGSRGGGTGGGRGPGSRGGGSNGPTSSGSSGPLGTSKGGSKHGRTTLPQAVGNTLRDRWKRRTPATPVLSKNNKPSSTGGPSGANGASKNGPKASDTLPGGVNGAPKGSPKPPGGIPPGRVNGTAKGGAKPGGPGGGKASGATGKPGSGRTTFWQAVGETMDDRWKKRRGAVTGCINPNPNANGKSSSQKGGAGAVPPGGRAARGPKNTGTPGGTGPGSGAKAGKGPWKHRPSSGPGKTRPTGAPGPAGSGPGTAGPAGAGAGGFTWAYTSPWDFAEPEPATHTVVQDGPARRNGTPWEPTEIAPGRPRLPKAGPPTLPRAPQRAAGQRPGTTRRKEAIPMEPAPIGTYAAAPRAGGMAPQHATEITAGDACKALEKLTTQGMEAHDDYDALSKSARKLLTALEAMAQDLAGDHNVGSHKLQGAVAELMNQVAGLVLWGDRAARDCLDAAELSETEEHALKRDHQPVIDATADAGLYTPSARLHNEN